MKECALIASDLEPQMTLTCTASCDVWITDDPHFKSPDGNPVFYDFELPILAKKTKEELRTIVQVKRIAKGGIVRE